MFDELREYNALRTDDAVDCSGEDDDANDRDVGVGLDNNSVS